MILSDSFNTAIFKQSFQRVFVKDEQGHLTMAFNATFDVLTTKELKVSGLIGSAISANKKSSFVGDTVSTTSTTHARRKSALAARRRGRFAASRLAPRRPCTLKCPTSKPRHFPQVRVV
jgi:protein transport protein SEC23